MLADEVLHHAKNEIIRNEVMNVSSMWVQTLGRKINR